MPTKDTVIEILYEVVDKLNRQLTKHDQLEKSTETILSGEGGQLDSLGIINFIIAVEQKLEDRFHIEITLTDEKIITAMDGPLHTIGTLADYIVERL